MPGRIDQNLNSHKIIFTEIAFYITAAHVFNIYTDELQQERNSCPLLRSCSIGSCHVGVSKRFSRSISLAVFCLHAHFILADQISCRSYVGSRFIACGLAVSYSFNTNHLDCLGSLPLIKCFPQET